MGEKKRSKQQVYTLVVQVGRKDGDGLPEGATGAGLVCYASGVDEAEAVRETVARSLIALSSVFLFALDKTKCPLRLTWQ